MNKNLPKDIVRYVKKEIARRIIIFALLESFTVCICVLSWKYLATSVNIVFHICVLLLFFILPFFFSGFPMKLIDKSWSGVVTEVFVKEETGTYTAAGVKAFPYTKNVIYLKVKKDNGEEARVIAREFGIRHHHGFPVPNEGDVTKHLNDYSVADTVYHFYGLKHNYIVKKNIDMIDCVVCGSQNHKERSDCLNCGHSLIKNI
ncbi:MAG: hypothetical protein IJY39_07560 [Clostridia bacterium]|nr:hypothetical protein [Clostridia bacterium]